MTSENGLRDRLERIWKKRRPDSEAGTELTAEGMEVATPSREAFLGNLEEAAQDKPAETLPHPRRDQNGE